MSYSNSAAQAATEVQAAGDIVKANEQYRNLEALAAVKTVEQTAEEVAASTKEIPGDVAANDITNATLVQRLEAIQAAAVVAQAAATVAVAVAVAKKAATIDPASKQSASNPCALFGEKRNKTPEDQQPKQEIQSTQKSH